MMKRSKRNRTRSRSFIKYILISLFPAALLLMYAADSFPDVIERWYSQGIYKFMAIPVAAVSSLFGFSLAEFLIPLAVLFGIYFIAREIWTGIKRRDGKRLLRLLSTVLAACSVVYFSFVFLWGLNYKRSTLDRTLGYEDVKPTKEDMAELFDHIIGRINTLCSQVPYDSNGASYHREGIDGILNGVWDGYEKLKNINPALYTAKGRVKKILGSEYMGYTGIDGIYIYLTGEPNVNYALPQFMLAPSAAHEAAHLQGFAREDEANFVGYLSLRENPDPFLRYSAYMFMYLYVSNDLAATDRILWSDLASKLDARAKREFVNYSEFRKKYESKVQEVTEKVNNAYLQAQGQQAGILTYSYVTRLLVEDFLNQKKSSS